MKKLLIILSSNEFLRNYIHTGVIDSLNKKYDCKIVISSKIFDKDEVKKLKNFAGYCFFDVKEEKRRFFLMDVILWRYRKKSTTFIYRFMRKSGLRDLNFFSNIKNLKEFLLFIKRNLKKNSLLFHMIFGNLCIFPFFIFIYKRLLTLNKDLEELIERIKPDLILYPSTAYEPLTYDIIEISAKKKIKTVFLIDNWDNLSSKTIFIKKPDFITVWGKQSLEHAVRIHGFKENKVIMIGTPRFDIYYKTKNNPTKSPINEKYVLFTGASLEMEETAALKELDEELEQNKVIYGNLKIIYRPHPWRQGKYDFNEANFKHVVLDLQMKDHYLRLKKQIDQGNNVGNLRFHFQPDLNHYPIILGNALFIVSPLTTMALEALLMEKRVLLIVYDDGKNFTTPKNVFKYYEHFRGIERLNGFVFCKEKYRLKQQFRELYKSMKLDGFKPVKSDLDYFLFNDNREYIQRLLDAIEYSLKSK